MFQFITRRHFLVNLIVAIGLLIGIIFLFLSLLNFITRHNQYEKVPEVTKMNYEKAKEALEGKGFKVEVMDSVWDPDIPPFTVISQSPAAGQTVKAHRLIFLTVNKTQPPIVEMPNLVGFSFRNALLYMNQLGLKLGDTTRKPDIAKDAVLEQLYNGQPIRPGTRIFEGSVVSFVLGSGLSEEDTAVPDLFGMTYADAKALLQGMGINIGALLTDVDVKDTASAFVYKQNPETMQKAGDGTKQPNRMKVGQSIDLWLSKEPRLREETPEIPEEELPEQ